MTSITNAIITRFAPSPTGLLHVGNVRTALINWLYARSQNGKFILRIDDTDAERSSTEYESQIIEDLKWLGLHWDESFKQSERTSRYESAKHKLISSGRLYPCYETVEELAMQKKSMLSRNLPPVYDRKALRLTDAEKVKYDALGIRPHWRFLLNNNPITILDGIRGPVRFDKLSTSDPVLIRADGSMTYTLCSVVDDIDYGITTIIRGEDHLTNSATQVQILEALDAPKIPFFAHLCLIEAKNGEISKRLGGFDIKSLRNMGIEAMAINSFFAKLGTSDPIEAYTTLKELVNDFELSKFGKARVLYDTDHLVRFNKKVVHNLPYSMVADRLKLYCEDNVDTEFWDAVRGNLNTVQEVKDWWAICRMPLKPLIIDSTFSSIASKILSEVEWNDDIWNNWVKAIQAKTGRNGHDLYMPLRAALTGVKSGPELKHLLPIIGYSKAYDRLNGRIA